jgi:hypothetical protein
MSCHVMFHSNNFETGAVTFGLHALVHVTAISGELRACPSKFTSRAEAANGLSAVRRRALARAPGHARVAGNRVRWARRLVTNEKDAAKRPGAVALRPGIWGTICHSQVKNEVFWIQRFIIVFTTARQRALLRIKSSPHTFCEDSYSHLRQHTVSSLGGSQTKYAYMALCVLQVLPITSINHPHNANARHYNSKIIM